jgi:hypothetical protein
MIGSLMNMMEHFLDSDLTKFLEVFFLVLELVLALLEMIST